VLTLEGRRLRKVGEEMKESDFLAYVYKIEFYTANRGWGRFLYTIFMCIELLFILGVIWIIFFCVSGRHMPSPIGKLVWK
jgi:hypothetical protein